ncbi:MAG: glycoside hydrolase family 2 TIM barrel-domain containing protein [Kiritimatiellia bacterium]|jgi:beta-galactosidase
MAFRQNFDDGWRFAKFGEQAGGNILPEPDGVEKPAFDDGSWRMVRLPHDWAVEEGFTMKAEARCGRLPYYGIGWYRKTFTLPPETAGRCVFLDIDGAMCDSTVFVNGHPAGGRPYGYTSFRTDLTPHLNPPGTPNVVAVRLHAVRESARWYPGAGIYRHVWLVTANPVHVAWQGVHVHVDVAPDGSATVSADVEVEGPGAERAEVALRIEGEEGMTLRNPRRWSPETPGLYTLVVEVSLDGETVDVVEQTFGVRTLEYRPTEGFFLNGVRRQMRGVCLHHDLGALGAAFSEAAFARQVRILKEMGCDAIRTSHNPPAPGMLDLCDRLGMMVLDEAFDMWEHAKTPGDYARFFPEWHERDLVDFLRRDRNHPCIVMWSIGNEVNEHCGGPDSPVVADGIRIGTKLRDIVRREDPTRPVTSGFWCPDAFSNGIEQVVDIFGANYLPQHYGAYTARTGRGILGAETCSMVSSRGEYVFPLTEGFFRERSPRPFPDGWRDGQVSSYDLYPLRGGNIPPELEFEAQDRNPHCYGEFVWTGFDYLGEPDPFGQPGTASRSSYYGIIDLCGFPKDRFYGYQAHWRPDFPMAHILPHWTWPGREGEVTPVHVYTSGDEAELFVNGVSQGRRRKGGFTYRLRWDGVVYQPGEVRVVAWKNGAPWAEARVVTAGAPARIEAVAETPELAADGRDLAYVRLRVLDAAGEPVPDAALRLLFAVEGPFDLAGVCNGDPTDHDSLQGSTIRTFHGLAQAIVRSRDARPGTGFLHVRVAGDALPPVRLPIVSR